MGFMMAPQASWDLAKGCLNPARQSHLATKVWRTCTQQKEITPQTRNCTDVSGLQDPGSGPDKGTKAKRGN
jgi:hypothetical protein